MILKDTILYISYQVSVYVSFKSKLQCFLSISLRFLQANPNSLSFEHMWHLACVKLG